VAGSRFDLIKNWELFEKVGAALNDGRNFVLTCHVRPDGDAIGSLLALGAALSDNGKDVTLYTEDPVPANLEFLPGTSAITHSLPAELPPATTLCILDCSEPKRIGSMAEPLVEQAEVVIVLDHHLDNGSFEGMEKALAYIDQDLFATGALVMLLFEKMNWPISKAVATCLYSAIITDTGAFRHSNTTAAAFEMASLLVEAGADPYLISNHLYQSYPERRIHLLGLVLRTLEVFSHGRVAVLQATPEMFRITGAKAEDTEDFVGFARCIGSVEVAVFVREVHAGHVTVSLRSKEYVNVAEIAKAFGGGGHFHAAGFTATGNTADVRDAILKELERRYGELG